MPTKQRIDYGRYLASREWRLKRKQVIENHFNICQRCGDAPIQNVHHLTYDRLGHEDVDRDLLGVCRPCHEFISAERDDDPAVAAFWRAIVGGMEPLIPEGYDHVFWWNLNSPTAKDVYFCLDFDGSDTKTNPGGFSVDLDGATAFVWWM